MTPKQMALLDLGRALQARGYGFVTPTPATHARVVTRPARAWARTLADVFGWSRPFTQGVVPADLVAAMRAAEVLEPVAGGFRSRVRFSTLQGLLFVHSAYPTSDAGSVFFGPDTYRFARAILAGLPRSVTRAVDIGCGAGPGAVLIARARPGAEVSAVDINPAALELTEVNAALAGVRVTARRSDLLGALEGAFDLIVANPPYLVDPGERTYRHGGGRWGAGLSLNILEAALARLAPGGTLLLYTGAAMIDGADPFLEEARRLLDAAGQAWRYEEVDPDVFGEELEHGVYAEAERIAAVLLTVAKTL